MADWRKEGQREELRPLMKGVGFCLNIAGFICFFGDGNCTVEINDGTEISLPISREIYRGLELGDQVLVYTGTGALGIEYAYFAGMIN